MIVKHHNGHGSEGMNENSKVDDMTSLISEVRRHLSTYGAALVEEFISGLIFGILPTYQSCCFENNREFYGELRLDLSFFSLNID